MAAADGLSSPPSGEIFLTVNTSPVYIACTSVMRHSAVDLAVAATREREAKPTEKVEPLLLKRSSHLERYTWFSNNWPLPIALLQCNESAAFLRDNLSVVNSGSCYTEFLVAVFPERDDGTLYIFLHRKSCIVK